MSKITSATSYKTRGGKTVTPGADKVILPALPPKPEGTDDMIDDSYMDWWHAARRMRDSCAKALKLAGIEYEIGTQSLDPTPY